MLFDAMTLLIPACLKGRFVKKEDEELMRELLSI